MSGFPGQTYNSASNMAGKIKSAQASLRKLQPLDLYVHCVAYCQSFYGDWLLGLHTDPRLPLLGLAVRHHVGSVRKM